jgi:hypothetical protein
MLLGFVLGSVLVQSTWIVDDDGGPNVHCTDLPAAVAAAADGDALLVRAGSYTHFQLSGKGLSFIGEPAVRVDKPGDLGQRTAIVNIPGRSRVLIDAFEFPGPPDCLDTRLAISGATTRVTLIDVAVTGHMGNCSVVHSSAIHVSSAAVVLVRATLVGGQGFRPFPSSGSDGGCALLATDRARIHVVESALTGGHGTAGNTYAGSGGPALFADSSSRVWVTNSDGTGGIGSAALSGSTGTGGAGILAQGFARVRVSGDMDGRISGGSGVLVGGYGIVASGGGQAVVHEYEVWVGQADFGEAAHPQSDGFQAAGPQPSLHVAGSFTPAGSVTVSLVDGTSGSLYLVWLEDGSSFPTPLPRSPIVGEFAFRPHWVLPLFAGVLSPAGDFSATVPVASIASMLHRPFRLQAAVGRAPGVLRLSNPVAFSLR